MLHLQQMDFGFVLLNVRLTMVLHKRVHRGAVKEHWLVIHTCKSVEFAIEQNQDGQIGVAI
jgi:hypothetical protein